MLPPSIIPSLTVIRYASICLHNIEDILNIFPVELLGVSGYFAEKEVALNPPLQITETLYDYILDHNPPESEAQRRCREDTQQMAERGMQIPPDQGMLFAFLTKLIGARQILEIGTFTGYSALAFAQALPEDGTVVSCDRNEKYLSLAYAYWKEAGVAHKICTRTGPALQTLNTLQKEGNEGTFDIAFIDADKVNYPAYFERCLALVRTGGLILVDNVLWYGSVVRPEDTDADVMAIQSFNDALRADNRIDLCMLGIGDGVTLARRRR